MNIERTLVRQVFSTTSKVDIGEVMLLLAKTLSLPKTFICLSIVFLQFSFSLKSSAMLCALHPTFSISLTVFPAPASSSGQVYEVDIRTLARHQDGLRNVQC